MSASLILPKDYRFHAYNASGATIADCEVNNILRWKMGSGGILEYEATPVDEDLASVADGAGEESSEMDNDTAGTRWMGGTAHWRINVTAGSPDGPARLYIQPSDDSTGWPDDDTGILVAQVTITATGDNNYGIIF